MGVPQQPCFLTQSAQSLEKKSVVLLGTAKKCKRVHKNMKKNGDSGSEECAADGNPKLAPYTPTNLHEYQKKRLTRFAFCK